MSPREIAELTGKVHRNVLRDIRTMLEELVEGVLSFEQTYTNPQNGQTYTEFALPKDLTLTLVAGYSVTPRHRIVTRWMELEEAKPPPSSPANTTATPSPSVRTATST